MQLLFEMIVLVIQRSGGGWLQREYWNYATHLLKRFWQWNWWKKVSISWKHTLPLKMIDAVMYFFYGLSLCPKNDFLSKRSLRIYLVPGTQQLQFQRGATELTKNLRLRKGTKFIAIFLRLVLSYPGKRMLEVISLAAKATISFIFLKVGFAIFRRLEHTFQIDQFWRVWTMSTFYLRASREKTELQGSRMLLQMFGEGKMEKVWNIRPSYSQNSL